MLILRAILLYARLLLGVSVVLFLLWAWAFMFLAAQVVLAP